MKTSNWFGIGVCFGAGLAAAFTMTKASPAALDLTADLHLSLLQIGWVMSMVALATVLLGVICGRLVQRFGALTILTGGVLILLIAPLTSWFVNSATLLLFERAAEGVGVILVMVAGPAMIIALSKPGDIGLSMGVWALWMPVGSSLIFLLAPLLLAGGGWRTLWLSSGIMAMLILPLLGKLPRVSVSASPQSLPSGIGICGAMLLGLIFACFSGGFFSILTYLPTYLHTVHGLTTTQASLLAALLPAVLMCGNMLGGALLHRGLHPAHLMATCALLISTTLWAALAVGEGVVGILLLTLFGLVTGIVPTAIFAQAPRFTAAPTATGLVIGIVVTGQGTGILLGPPLIGYLVGPTHNWVAAHTVLLILPLIIAALSTQLARFEPRRTVHHQDNNISRV